MPESYGGKLPWGSFLVLAGLLATPAYSLWQFFPIKDVQFAGGWVLVLSILTFWLYWIDKKRARKGEWRVTENALQLMAFLGGWPGAFVAQKILRHKSSKASFQFTFWLIILLYQYIAIDALLDWRIAKTVSDWVEKVG